LLRTPAPNLLFARDLWVCIGDTIAVGWPAMPARWRDGVLARAVARHHPLLQGRQVLDIREARGAGQSRCLEGGDVLVLGPDLILVGVGERTNWAGAVALHAALQANPPAGQQPPRVVAVRLPDQRAMMHLDTVVTCVAPGLALAYLPVFDPASPDGQRVELFDLSQPDVALGADLAAWLPRWGHPMTLLPCGGGQAGVAEREQWSDGANALCLGPGQIVLYGRNRATLQVLNQNGFEIMGPDRYIANAALYARTAQRLVVALPGSELSRGRGGPRCLTLPLARQSLSLGRFAT
jgi:arginine deiminase